MSVQLFPKAVFLTKHRRSIFIVPLILSSGLCAVAGLAVSSGSGFQGLRAQETFPSPPADRTLVYTADEKKALTPIAFETGTTPLRIETTARRDKRSYVELKGQHAATVIANDEPRFYVFLPDEASAKPPFIVRLTEKGNARRVTAMSQKGYTGFAIVSDEIVKPHYRVLSREGGMIFMEIRLREPLMLGEYAVIGTDLQRIAAFRISLPST